MSTVLIRITLALKKISSVGYVYNPTLAVGAGSSLWMKKLLASTLQSFINELQQIAEKHDDVYIQTLLTEMKALEKSSSNMLPTIITITVLVLLALIGLAFA